MNILSYTIILILAIFIVISCIYIYYNIERFETEAVDITYLFEQQIKSDFDLYINNDNKEEFKELLQTFNQRTDDEKRNLFNIIQSSKSNKKLIDFDDEDIYDAICQGYISHKDPDFITKVKLYYENYLNKYAYFHERFVYENLGMFLKEIKKTDNIKTSAEIKSSKYVDRYDAFIDSFLDAFIYQYFDINETYKSYIENINKNQNISIQYDYIVSFISKIKERNAIIYEDPLEFQKRLLKLSNIMSLIENYIDNVINEILQNNDKCWIQNNGDIDVDMRTCSVYFIEHRNMCDMFEDIYNLSTLQIEFLIKQNTNIYKTYTINDGEKTIYIYDDMFLNIINNNDKNLMVDKNRKVILKKKNILSQFINGLLKQVDNVKLKYEFENLKKVINDIIYNIYNLSIKYNGNTYFCLDLYRILKQKLENKNIQLCKTKIPELKEVSHELDYNYKVEKKILNYNHINPIELWGSCFYNLKDHEINDISKQKQIIDNLNKKYNITPSCDNNVIENIKCKSGCFKGNQNKFLSFDTTSFGNSKTILNNAINIPEHHIFMKITINNIGNFKNLQCKYKISFVSFDNVTKKFKTYNNNNNLNTIIRNNLFNIKPTNIGFSVVPNISQKNIYSCSFYNGTLYKYNIRNIAFSLKDILVKDIYLGNYDFYRKIRSNLSLNQCNSQIYNTTKDCLNNIKNTLNDNEMNNLKNILQYHENRKSNLQNSINNINSVISNKEQEYYRSCSNPFSSLLMKAYLKVIENYNSQISKLNNNLRNHQKDKKWWEQSYRAVLIWEWISKAANINELNKKISNTQNEINQTISKRNNAQNVYNSMNIRCNNINNEINNLKNQKNNYQNTINNEIDPQIRKITNNIHNYQRSPQYLQNIENYHINNINFVKEILKYNNNTLSQSFIKKYLATLNDQILLFSNDNSIYIQIN